MVILYILVHGEWVYQKDWCTNNGRCDVTWCCQYATLPSKVSLFLSYVTVLRLLCMLQIVIVWLLMPMRNTQQHNYNMQDHSFGEVKDS